MSHRLACRTRLLDPATRPLLAAAAALGLACGAAASVQPTACAADADCASDAHCRAGTCVGDVPPVARLSGPRSALANVELEFDSAASSDEDDAVAAWRWSVRATSGTSACPPQAGLTTAATFHPVFGCPGEYEVTLVVRDRAGLESRPATQAVSITSQVQVPPSLVVAADVAVAHRCEGTPLSCSTIDADGARSVRLQARARDLLGSDAVRYRWDWTPPPGVAAAGAPTVTFEGGPEQAAPLVTLATAGTAIAGTWRFVVTVTDRNGLSTRDEQRVVVQNRPPQLVGGEPLAVPHSYDAAGQRYLATGLLTATWSDPDGDPVLPEWRFTASAPDHCAFGFAAPFAAPGTTFTLACADPAELIGAVAHAVELTVADANGATAAARWPVTVTNRPPVIAPLPPTMALPHGVDDVLAPTAFVVLGDSPFSASDPDGDPLPAVAVTPLVDVARAPHAAARAVTGPDGRQQFRLTADVAHPLELRGRDGSSPFTVRGDVADAWAAAAPVSFAVQVLDRPPAPVLDLPAQLALDHRYDGSAYVARAQLGVLVDPDGDPLAVADSGSSAPCARPSLARGPAGDALSVECRVEYAPSAGTTPPLARLIGAQRAGFTVTDPWGLAHGGTVALQIQDRPITVAMDAAPLAVGAGEDCWWDARWGWYAGERFATAPITVADPDGDPVQLSWSIAADDGGVPCGTAPANVTCVPGSAACAGGTLSTCSSVTPRPVARVAAVATDGIHAFPVSRAVELTCVAP